MSGGPSQAFIPPVRLDNADVWQAVLPRLEELVRSGQFILGTAVQEFETEAARSFGCPWAVGTSSGTSALVLALRAAPLPPGARVALPANTFYAAFEAVVMAGHIPVITDHDEDYLINPEMVEPLDVDAVMAVHLYGLPVHMAPLMELAEDRGWWVLEDASQAHGATAAGRPVGSLGHAAAFSAYPTKNLGAWGDAGFVTGADADVACRIRSLRHHAQGTANVHDAVGGTERLDSIQALVLTEKLRRLPDEVRARRAVAGWYREALADLGLDLPGDRGDRAHAYHQFVIRVPERDAVRVRMAELGVGTGIHYPTPIHLQRGARERCEVPATP
ncbi:MAG: DegT/DnrJ/EryC1/StrS family aminotransferase, partial [Methanobacteriota archaeon]